MGRVIPPKLEWVVAFCKERKNAVDPERFFAHYESNGWRVGKNPMKSWKTARPKTQRLFIQSFFI